MDDRKDDTGAQLELDTFLNGKISEAEEEEDYFIKRVGPEERAGFWNRVLRKIVWGPKDKCFSFTDLKKIRKGKLPEIRLQHKQVCSYCMWLYEIFDGWDGREKKGKQEETTK